MENVHLSLQQGKASQSKSAGTTECLWLKRQQREQPLARIEEPFQSQLHSWSSLREVRDPLEYLKPPACRGEEHIGCFGCFLSILTHLEGSEDTFQTEKQRRELGGGRC